MAQKKSIWHKVAISTIFVALAAAIIAIMPQRSGKFNYYFEIGKPWGYSLLTANQDFPIYKTESQLQQERQQVLSQFVPYYYRDTAIENSQKRAILQLGINNNLKSKQQSYLESQLAAIYAYGIIDAAEADKLSADGYEYVMIMADDNVASKKQLKTFYTPRSAYEKIVKEASLFSADNFRNLEMHDYLLPNIVYDASTSEKIKQQMLSAISPTQGMVQMGEKIIDRGEIVTDRSFQVLSSLKRVQEEQAVNFVQAKLTFMGNSILICVFIGLLISYLHFFRNDILSSKRNVLFFCLLVFLITAVSGIVLRYSTFAMYVVPFAWVIVLARVFYDTRTAFQTYLLTCLIVSLYVPAPFEFLTLQISVGLVCLPCLKDLSQRSQLAVTSAWIFITYSVVYTAFTLSTASTFEAINPWVYMLFFANATLLLVSYGFIYLCERGFGYVSSMSLVELTNVNSTLMLRFAEQASGSFQHSLQVSNLATEAAKRIGANALLVRTGALYHDIGKLAAPQNFTENQTDGYNPLSSMSYEKAAQTIISHVADGVKLAKKNNLPALIISFIESHHGTSKVRYFYNSYVNTHPNEQVDESLFTYPGPKPQTKETAILMMADAVEARSRSLNEYTEESIKTMVENMISQQISDGQLSETPLSFKDVEDIKKVFVERLISIYHHRISYPEINKKQ
mgnify:CR=1 FL=1